MKYLMFVCTDPEPDTDKENKPDIDAWVAENGIAGRRLQGRALVAGMPIGKSRARLTSMADATGITIIAVDPAYTSKWGAQHWQKPPDQQEPQHNPPRRCCRA